MTRLTLFCLLAVVVQRGFRAYSGAVGAIPPPPRPGSRSSDVGRPSCSTALLRSSRSLSYVSSGVAETWSMERVTSPAERGSAARGSSLWSGETPSSSARIA